jgi:cardiolipin synthase
LTFGGSVPSIDRTGSPRLGPMRITANQVTLLRLVFLPIPCALLFEADWQKALALAFFVVIGLTDYLDGYLARKQGPTKLGALIDPIADKIFVAAMFIPLVRMEAVPVWMAVLLFVREFLVTELRGMHGVAGVEFRTAELAKYKTTIQMIGGGIVILNVIFGPHRGVLLPLGGFFLFALALAAVTYFRSGRLGPRILTFVGLVGWALGMRCIFSYTTTNWAIMALVVGVTLASGIQYLLQSWRGLKVDLGRLGPRGRANSLGIGIAFPVIFISSLHFKEVSAWMILVIVALEFVNGGLRTTLSGSVDPSDRSGEILRTVSLLGAGLCGLALPLLLPWDSTAILNALFLGMALASAVHCARGLYVHRRALMLGCRS